MLLPQLFLQRLNAACLWSDCISGMIVTAAIILSFLSLMTFADFLADQLLRWGDLISSVNAKRRVRVCVRAVTRMEQGIIIVTAVVGASKSTPSTREVALE